MKGLIPLAVVLSLVALACGDSSVGTAGGADPPPSTVAAPPTTPPTTAPPPEGSVRVAITGTLTTGPDGLVEVCKVGATADCFGVVVDGDLGGAQVGEPEAHRLVGDYDGRAIRLTEPPQPLDLAHLAEPDFSTPCDGLPRARDEEGMNRIQRYAESVLDSYAGSWWDQSAGVFTVWFTGDDVSEHEAAIAAATGGTPVCVWGGAEYTEAELRRAQDEIVPAFADEAGMSWASLDTLRNRVTVDVEHVDQELAGRMAAVHPGVEVIAFIEMLDGSLADLPEPVPVRPGDVELVVSTVRGGDGMDALGLFTLGFDPDLGCFYFEDGESSIRVLPVWPLGFSAVSGPPPQVFDRNGEVFATAGDVVEVGGGNGGPPSEDMGACGADGTWYLNI